MNDFLEDLRKKIVEEINPEGISIIDKDNRGSTPLHWACFSHSELSLMYILAWVEGANELGIQDDVKIKENKMMIMRWKI